MACAHTAVTLNSFLAQECHAVDFLDWWQKITTKPVIVNGYIPVPDTPGLGIELNEAVIKEHLRYAGYFEPNPESRTEPETAGRGLAALRQGRDMGDQSDLGLLD